MKICILDYGSGNVKSVYNMFSSLINDVHISNLEEDIMNADKLVLPGVGAFGASMSKIKETIPLKVLENEVLLNKKPILGICVGMQVLFTKGYEFGEFDGLNWIKGDVRKLETKGHSLPHIGWNEISILRENHIYNNEKAGYDFYFVHSYVCQPENSIYEIATCDYGQKFCSIVNKENIFGVQFHPEKSQIAGKKLIKNFIDFNS